MRMSREAVLTVAALTLMTACMTRTHASNADRDVISAVVRQICKQTMADYIVLSSSTSVVIPVFTPGNMDEPARRSLLERNKVSAALPIVETCEALRLVDRLEIDRYLAASALDSHDRWAAFYEKFTNAVGVMSLSLPGYSTDGDLAIVQVASACGETCGGGSFWLLRRVSGQWQVEVGKVIPGWQS